MNMPKQIHVVLILLLAVGLNSCRSASSKALVVYVSEDQIFSEPILKDFERETAITVKSVFDTEESKSTGVMNRLIAEKDNPQADIYWANEPVRADALKQRGVSTAYVSPSAEGIPDQFKDPDHYWTGFSARARLLLVNARSTIKPASVMAYTDPLAKGRAAIANPLFGTTTDYVAALFAIWGDDRARTFMNDMKRNGVKTTTSNGESADFVAAGQVDFSLVDSDDAVNRKKQGKPVEIVYPDQDANGLGVLILPNAVALIKGGPHPENGKQLIDYLLSRSTERKLAFADCAQIPLHSGVDTPPEVRRIEDIKPMRVGYADLARKMEEIQPFLKEWAGQ
ncbi:MAG: iron ABC transporter substrate-binding protein [Verrucomicrobia bacterium]|nr:MAG: iron ABC transporter substrate-binding protein [Verrucomicrobiota bacterium]